LFFFLLFAVSTPPTNAPSATSEIIKDWNDGNANNTIINGQANFNHVLEKSMLIIMPPTTLFLIPQHISDIRHSSNLNEIDRFEQKSAFDKKSSNWPTEDSSSSAADGNLCAAAAICLLN